MRTDVRKWTHRFPKVFNANAHIVVRKCVHCLKWRWSSPGSGSRCTIAVLVHHWCTITALLWCLYIVGALSQHYRGVCTSLVHYRSTFAVTTVQRCTVMLSPCCNIINTTYTLTVYAEAHRWNPHHWRSIAVTTVHCCTIMLSQCCNIVLSCSYDIVMMFYHKVVI